MTNAPRPPGDPGERTDGDESSERTDPRDSTTGEGEVDPDHDATDGERDARPTLPDSGPDRSRSVGSDGGDLESFPTELAVAEASDVSLAEALQDPSRVDSRTTGHRYPDDEATDADVRRALEAVDH